MARYMKPNHGTRVPRRNIAFDTETQSQQIKRIHTCDRLTWTMAMAVYWETEDGKIVNEQWLTAYDPSQLWYWIDDHLRPRQPLTLWAHNLGFDLTISEFWQQLDIGRYRLSIPGGEPRPDGRKPKRPWRGKLVAERSPCYFKVLGQKGTLQGYDLFNYLPMPLRDVGKSVGKEKLEIDLASCTLEELETYCRRDVEIVQLAVHQLLTTWATIDGGVWQPTSSKLALNNWRHEYLSETGQKAGHYMLLDEDTEKNDSERRGYYGGRVEPFYYGVIERRPAFNNQEEANEWFASQTKPVGPIWELDVNSLYPYVMREFLYPCRRQGYEMHPPVEKLRQRIKIDGCMACVRLNTPHHAFPVRRPQGLVFATGRFTTILCGNELETALDLGIVESCHSARWYVMAPLFRDWVDGWWRRKEEAEMAGNESFRLFCKMILNGLSGKWGQAGMRWEDAPEEEAMHRWGQWEEMTKGSADVRLFRAIAGHVQERIRGDDPAWSFPAISAMITANGREHMSRLIDLCPDGSVYYIATDCLYVSDAGYEALLAAGQVKDGVLGKLKVKGVYPDGEVNGVNDLRVGNKCIQAGLPAKSRQVSINEWETQIWESLPEILSRVPDGSVHINKSRFVSMKHVWKNTMNHNGWAYPIMLGEEEGWGAYTLDAKADAMVPRATLVPPDSTQVANNPAQPLSRKLF